MKTTNGGVANRSSSHLMRNLAATTRIEAVTMIVQSRLEWGANTNLVHRISMSNKRVFGSRDLDNGADSISN
mgnify:CR=1